MKKEQLLLDLYFLGTKVNEKLSDCGLVGYLLWIDGSYIKRTLIMINCVQRTLSLNITLCILGLYNIGSALALDNTCDASFQVVNYTPQVCYSEYNSNTCVDTCEAADPEFQPLCFKSLSIPCDTLTDLRETATGFQQRENYSWFHVSDLLTYEALLSDLNIFQQQLYIELYAEFINPPSYFGFSPASDQFRRENFRLALLSSLERLTTPLRYAAVYRRFTLGVSLENTLNNSFSEMFRQIDTFPYFSSTQKSELKTELNSARARQVRFWQLLKNYEAEKIASGRVNLLNRRIETYVSTLKLLPIELQDKLINKSSNLPDDINVQLVKCGNDICFNKIVAPSNALFYPDFDLQLLNFERVLVALSNEAAAFTNVYDGDYQVIEPSLLKSPDFAGFINNKLADYKALRSHVNLERLATAINIAYLSKNQTGKEILARLAQQSDTTENMGLSSIAALDKKPILLCKEFREINPELSSIQQESFDLALQGREMISLITQGGYTQALMDQLTSLITRLNELAARSVVIANIEQFTDDRLLTMNWSLFDLHELNENKQLIEIEYFEYNGMFWTPTMSAGLSELFPAIESIGTSINSMLPNGIATNSPLNDLQITLKQSAYNACSLNNQEINMVIKVTDEQGSISRQVLTSKFEQI